MTTTPIYPPQLPSVKRSRLWFWLSLANLALLAYGLPQAGDTILALFIDFHAKIGPLTKLALSFGPIECAVIGLGLAAWSIQVQRSGKSAARTKRFHIWMMVATNCVALLYAAALMSSVSNLIERMSN